METVDLVHEVATCSVDTKHGASATFGNGDTIGFIRVRKRKLKGGHPAWREYREAEGSVAVSATSYDLVRAVRVNGKPRHQFIIGFGSQKGVERYRSAVLTFWTRVVSRMLKHGLTEPQCQRLLAEMVRKGARLPTVADCESRLHELEGKPDVWPYSSNKANLVAFMAFMSRLEA